jgi:hypothetical protein
VLHDSGAGATFSLVTADTITVGWGLQAAMDKSVESFRGSADDPSMKYVEIATYESEGAALPRSIAANALRPTFAQIMCGLIRDQYALETSGTQPHAVGAAQ